MEANKYDQVFSMFPKLKGVLDNPLLSKEQKSKQALPYIKQLKGDIKENERQTITIIEQKEALESLDLWIGSVDFDDARIEINDCSRMHLLAESMKSDSVIYCGDKENFEADKLNKLFNVCHSFVVEHDWASAFNGAEGYDDSEINLPYPVTVFEFRVGGATILNVASENNQELTGIDDSSFVMTPFIFMGNYWVCPDDSIVGNKAFTMIYEQVKAICIALEAEVAISEVMRAPSKLNEKRAKKGKLPLFDYHVVKLNRSRRESYNGGGTHRSPRFHFRRGHWRHFENHKTYIKWMLVGSPELGFIDKHYKL